MVSIDRYTYEQKFYQIYILAGEIFDIAGSCSEKLFIDR